MLFDLERVRANVQEATTEDLLDRVTVFADGMEPEALDVIEAELRQRGLTAEDIREHEERRKAEGLLLDGGTAAQCSLCRRPAIARDWGWHWLWGLVPLFPRRFFWCAEHRPEARPERDEE